MKGSVPVLIALAFSAASVTALAAEERPGAGGQESAAGAGSATAMPSFEQADKDGSGAVEVSEATGIAGLDLSAADKDNDGKLSRSEYEAAKQSHESRPGGPSR